MSQLVSVAEILGQLPVAPSFEQEERERWLAERRLGIGGSDAAALFNEGYGCERRLAYDKRGVEHDYGRTRDELDILERGTELETIIADKFARVTGLRLRQLHQPRVSKSNHVMRVNIDRQIVTPSYQQLVALCPHFADAIPTDPGPGVLECKSANEWVFKKVKHEGLPADYLLQIQHALAVTGYKYGFFAVLEPSSFKLIWFGVLPDARMADAISRRAGEFWRVVEDPSMPLPPALPQGDRRCGSCQYRKTCRGSLGQDTAPAFEDKTAYEVDDSLADLLNDYKMARTSKEQAEFIVETIAEQIKQRLGEREAVEVPSATCKVSWKQQKPSLVWDSKALEADHPELAEKYKRPKKAARVFKVIDF